MTKEELEKENSRLILGNKLLSEKLISVTREKIDLQKKNTELKEKLEILILVGNVATKGLNNQLNEAKDIIKNIIHVTWGEGWNYSLDWKVKAEQFLKEMKEK